MPGERVRTADGWVTAETLARWWGFQEVHNLEVDRDHRFLVGGNGVVSHNADCDKKYVTYTKEGPNGEIYAGRASGTGKPQEILERRDASHHMNNQGYGPAKLDQVSTNKDAIRGREQY